MADKEIGDLTDGGVAQSGDEVHAVRGVNSRRIALGTAASNETTDFATAAQGATADAALPATSYTASDVLTKIKTVDGTGSGLDADTLDGSHASAFATADQGALADSAVQPGDIGTAASATLDIDATLAANSDTKIASQKAVKSAIATAIANLLDSAPGALDTLNELAASLGDDPNFATTVTNALALKLAIANDLSDLHSATTALTNLGLTANAKSLVTAANYAAMRTLLGLATVATSGAYSDLSGAPTLGTAAAKGAGTGAGDVLLLATANKLPALDASALTNLPSSGGVSSEILYTSTQTITIPTGATKAFIRLAGAGGAGGGTTGAPGGGGGGGLFKTLSGLTAGNTLSLTIGAGGSASGGGQNGGNSTLASGTQTITTLTASGGTNTGGNSTGGGGTNGDLNLSGGFGWIMTSSNSSSGFAFGLGGLNGFGMPSGGGTQAAGLPGWCLITWY